MSTLLIGANGQLGSDLRQVFSDQKLVPLARTDCELTDLGQVRVIDLRRS
jgi:dTDP-4-dehydrorhamnose reductase